MKQRKRLLAVLLAGVIGTVTAACGQAGGNDAADQTAAPAAEGATVETAESTEEDGPLTPYKEPVTITWGVPASAVQQFNDGDSYDDNEWTRLIKEKLNIDVKVAFSADASTDAFNNKMNTVLATGEFPDVVKFDNFTYFRQAQEAGYLMDISDVFDKYATDEVKAYRDQYPDSFNGMTIDGSLYGFPYMNDNFHQAAFLWIRDDWLKNTNSEPPKTVEEMVELARKFTFEDPDGNGKDDTYGFGLQGDVVVNNVGTLMGLAGAYGVPGYGENGIFYRGEDGKMTFSWIQPQMKEVLSLVHDMYDEGLIDPEFMSLDTSQMEGEVTNGTIGMMYHMNWGTWHPFNFSYQADGVITRPYPIPTEKGYTPLMGINNNENNEFFMISSQCEHPEAIIKILNLYEQVAMSSENPDDFATYWANEQYRLCPIYIGIPTELFAPVVHEALAKGSSDGLTGTALEYYNYVTGFEDGSLKDDTNAYGTWGQMFLQGEGGSMKIALDYKDKGWLVQNQMGAIVPDIWVQNSSVLADMVETTYVDIIVGNKPVDYFDEFVQNWLNAGGQKTLDELEAMHPAE
jgi:putative aldouronate transport system substrate-binding protein